MEILLIKEAPFVYIFCLDKFYPKSFIREENKKKKKIVIYKLKLIYANIKN